MTKYLRTVPTHLQLFSNKCKVNRTIFLFTTVNATNKFRTRQQTTHNTEKMNPQLHSILVLKC